MNKNTGRIYFIDGPYPNGHEIKEFTWSGRIAEDEQLRFDFHLKTAEYYAEDPVSDDEDDDTSGDSLPNWQSKIMWGNYHSCTLSSTEWGDDEGILIDTSQQLFSFDTLLEELSADILPLPKEAENAYPAFGIYLQGHDSCADHRIRFIKHDGQTDLEWTGKIALSYFGHYTYEYSFRALIHHVTFDGFHYPKEWSQEQAEAVFKTKVADMTQFTFTDLNPKSRKRHYKLVPNHLWVNT